MDRSRRWFRDGELLLLVRTHVTDYWWDSAIPVVILELSAFSCSYSQVSFSLGRKEQEQL